MSDQEVGRWKCGKCGGTIVAAGPRTTKFKDRGAFTGQCPWECGAWVNRGFRRINPGDVRAYRADEWDTRAFDDGVAASARGDP
jgi:hypothetical protein